jgi:hypothetical protein
MWYEKYWRQSREDKKKHRQPVRRDPRRIKEKRCALADRHTLSLSRPGVVLQRGARLRKRPQRRAAGRPAVAWLVDTPASRDPAYAMVRPALIRASGDITHEAMAMRGRTAGTYPYLNPDATLCCSRSEYWTVQSVVSTSYAWRILILEVSLPLSSPSSPRCFLLLLQL